MKKIKSLIRQYDLSFAGLKDGIHEFEFQIDEAFFRYYPSFDFVEKGEGVAKVKLEKKPNFMQLFFSISASVRCLCDRCGDEMVQPISTDQQLIVKFGEELYDETEEIITLSEKDHKINLMDLLYEFLYLSLPLKFVHKEGECDEESLSRLNGFDDDLEKEKENEIDPRWEALKKLK